MTTTPRSRSRPTPRPSIIAPSVVGDRYVQLTPGLRRRRRARRRRDPRRGPHRGPARARPDLRQPRRPDRRARPDGRQQQRRAVRPARDDRRRTSAARASSSTRRSRTSARSARPSTTTRRSCSAPPRELQGFISTLAENDQTVRDFNQSLGRRVRRCWPASARSWPPSLRNLGDRPRARSVDFVAREPGVLGRNIHGLNRVAKVLVKQRDALDEILEAAPLALNNLGLTYNPQAGTLDTNANIGELVDQIADRPGAFLCAHRRPGRRPRRRPLRPDRDAAAAAHRGRSALGTGSRTDVQRTVRPDASAASWRSTR